jgi:hypothetical protein
MSASKAVELLFEFPRKKTKYQKHMLILDFHVATLATLTD